MNHSTFSANRGQRRTTFDGARLAFAALIVLIAACLLTACSSDEEELGTSSDALLARSTSLWPIERGALQAVVRICWTQPLLGTAYRAPGVRAPDVASILAWGKSRVQNAIEREWNVRTAIRFVGFRDCDADPRADFRLTPIDSAVSTSCGAPGQSCVDALGTELRGGTMYINLFFGVEAFYTASYYTLAGATADTSLAVQTWWLPAFCMEELKKPWHPNAADPNYRADLRAPSVLQRFFAIYENCLQGNALHEFGHAAGFGHEQYRTDDPASAKACKDAIAARGIGDDFTGTFEAARPLGPFDFESIMSYCRRDKRAALTLSDIVMTHVAYRFRR